MRSKRKSHESAVCGRQIALILCLLVIHFTLQSNIIFSVIAMECWSLEDFWLGREAGSLFYVYALVYGLLLIWTVIEACLLWGRDWVEWTVALSAVFVISTGLGLWTFWQHMAIARGDLIFEDYSVKLIERQNLIPFPLSIREYIRRQWCSAGQSMEAMKPSDKACLVENYYRQYPSPIFINAQELPGGCKTWPLLKD